MHIPTARRRYVAALALTALALTGCSSGHATDSADSSASPGATPTASALPSVSPGAVGAASPQARPTSIADWPTTPAPPQDVPESVRTSVMAKGYTGQSFLDQLAADWHITLKKREKLTGTSGTIWRVVGEGHPTKKSELTVAAFWSPSGGLRSFDCSTTANAPRYEDFLRACIGLDHPGSTPKAAAGWLDGVKPEVDKEFAKTKVPIMSPLLRSGTTVTCLLKSSSSPAATYNLKIFGAADAEK